MNYQLDLELLEPASFGRLPMVGNESLTLTSIPATAIRGALAAASVRQGKSARLESWFGLDGARWSPAWSVPDDGGYVVPMPFCFLADKGDPGFGGKGVRDAFVGELPEHTGNHRHQWQRLRGQWLKLDSLFHAADEMLVTTATDMHVGLFYPNQSHRTSALYSRSYIAADHSARRRPHYRGYVTTLGGSDPGIETQTVHMGKRRSSSGAARLACKPLPGSIPVCRENPCKNGVAYLQLLTDAIVPDPHGGYLRGLTDAFLKTLLGKDTNARITQAFSLHGLVAGWSGAWGIPREQAVVILAGSAFKIEGLSFGEEAAIRKLAASGLGIRRNEGFGFVAVNPEWLAMESQPFGQQSGATPALRQSQQPPLPWPGTSEGESAALRGLVAKAASFSQPEDRKFYPILRSLASLAARLDDPTKVRAYLDRMAGRSNPRLWKDLPERFKREIESMNNIHQCRFFIEVAALFAGGNRRSDDAADESL